MSSAAERAEARRKAILAKRGDRLAKLTTTARGDEGVYLSDDVSSRSKVFLGEESIDMPTPPRVSVSPYPTPTPSKSAATSPPTAPSPPSVKPETLFGDVDDSVWSPELQEHFRKALLNANPMHSNASGRVPSGASASGRGHSPGPQVGSNLGGGQGDIDPLAEMMASLGGGAQGSPGSDMFSLLQQMRQGAQPAASPESENLKRDKAIKGIVQLVSAWLLLAYFVFFLEPSAYRARVGTLDVGRWTRWAILGENRNMLELLQTFIVQPQPAFFWAFAALETVLHFDTLRNIFSSSPGKSHLGALGPISKVLGVFNVIMLFLNDLGSIVFALGLVVLLAGYATPK
ncbi:hypothetical protein D9756_004327 [Leucocoprinus leucothites]|uniref:Golgi to ER traffic protein 2 n=1 Tax=Leucocoprinus leucothites TaxID=201217 RepID=A0A8H5D9W8_9AGAR|nr:hypothetical protein D9756_004327 [Leucoagaricus leucothites]